MSHRLASLLSLLLCVCIASGERGPEADADASTEKAARKVLGEIATNKLIGLLGKEATKNALTVMGAHPLETFMKLKQAELRARDVSTAVDQRVSFVKKEVAKTVAKVRKLQLATTKARGKENALVGQDDKLTAKDSTEACTQHPLGCVSVGLPGVLIKSKAQAGRSHGKHLAGAADLEKQVNDYKELVHIAQKHWAHTSRIQQFYKKEAGRAVAKTNSALILWTSIIAKRLVQHGMSELLKSGRREVLQTAVEEKLPNWKQVDMERKLAGKVRQWGQKKQMTATKEAEASLKAIVGVIEGKTRKSLGKVEVPNVLEDVSQSGFWDTIKSIESSKAQNIQAAQKRHLKAVLKHLAKVSAKGGSGAVTVIDGDQEKNALKAGEVKQEMFEKQSATENAVAAKVDMYARPTKLE